MTEKRNEKEFDEALTRLGDLYEEGKDCLAKLWVPVGCAEETPYLRCYEVLREMRDLAAMTLRKYHDVNNN